jgi:hypothetical protein
VDAGGVDIDFLGGFEDIEELHENGMFTMQWLGLLGEVGTGLATPSMHSIQEEDMDYLSEPDGSDPLGHDDCVAEDEEEVETKEPTLQPPPAREKPSSSRRSSKKKNNVKNDVPFYARWVPNSAVDIVSYLLWLE